MKEKILTFKFEIVYQRQHSDNNNKNSLYAK